MSVFGVFKPTGYIVLPLRWFQGVAEGLDFFYWYGVPFQGQDLIPTEDGVFDIGSSDKRFHSIYALFGYFDEHVETNVLDSNYGLFDYYVQTINVYASRGSFDKSVETETLSSDYGLFDYYVSSKNVQAESGEFEKEVRTSSIYSELGYFDNNVYVQGKRVLKDFDPIQLYAFIDEAKQDISLIQTYLCEIRKYVKPAIGVKSLRLAVSTSPMPLYADELHVKRILLKMPKVTTAVLYVGNSTSQDFPLFEGDELELKVEDPRKVYVKSTEDVNVFCLFELIE
ncbi:MAG: hypothetical protein DRP11_00890 [Candidatus Aenigmatarchaeota archaeon]|nr:MAG: hypothetical protein DRP11_00890 [Candidatus Aenigmarchaeota archaeon]